MQNNNNQYDHSTNMNEDILMSMADDMAAAATSFNSHGYEVFILSRELFKETLHDFVTKFTQH